MRILDPTHGGTAPPALAAARAWIDAAREPAAETESVPRVLADGANDWLVWQLVDSAFPTGGYAHSSGLEAARQHGAVPNASALIGFAEASLDQLAHAALPFVSAVHAGASPLVELDRLCDAFTSNHVANRASRLQGRAFFGAMTRIFFADPAGSAAPFKVAPPSALAVPNPASGPTQNGSPHLPFAHFAPVFGALARHIGIGSLSACRMFTFGHLRSLIAAAVRLNIVGPMEGQQIQARLALQGEKAAEEGMGMPLAEISQTSPLLELWQGAHDRLYSRLFQS